MKRKINTCLFLLMPLALFLVSCDWKVKIAVVKNNTTKSILVTKQLDKFATDSIVNIYNEFYREYVIDPQKSEIITLSNRVLSKEPDSKKIYLYVFDMDTLNKYLQLKKSNGILKHSLLKKIEIQLNKVKEPLDTIYINGKN